METPATAGITGAESRSKSKTTAPERAVHRFARPQCAMPSRQCTQLRMMRAIGSAPTGGKTQASVARTYVVPRLVAGASARRPGRPCGELERTHAETKVDRGAPVRCGRRIDASWADNLGTSRSTAFDKGATVSTDRPRTPKPEMRHRRATRLQEVPKRPQIGTTPSGDPERVAPGLLSLCCRCCCCCWRSSSSRTRRRLKSRSSGGTVGLRSPRPCSSRLLAARSWSRVRECYESSSFAGG